MGRERVRGEGWDGEGKGGEREEGEGDPCQCGGFTPLH